MSGGATSEPSPLAVVAAEAGVSAPTVSKVLHGRPDVAAATRERVAEALARHGHELRRARKRTGLIDVRVIDLDGTWSEAVVGGAAEAARHLGYDIVLAVDPDPDDCARWVARALRRGTDGLVSVVTVPAAEAARAARNAGIPLVVVDPRTRPPEGMLSVGVSNFAGALEATEHLLALGHRRIATITGALDQDNAMARLAGYRTALDRAGIGVDDDLVCTGNYGVDAGNEAAARLVGLPDPPTAIVAASDDTAVGALHALRAAGKRVPADISLVGFDDLPISRWIDPPLTTVRQPLAELGGSAVEMVHKALGGKEPVRVDLATRLVVRESAASPVPGPARVW